MAKNTRRVRLRPHHFMCVHGFQGHGYSPKFVTNFWRVLGDLGDPAGMTVEVVEGTEDDICVPCPNNEGALCKEDRKIRLLDDAYAATLGIKPGDAMSWEQAKTLVGRLVSDEEFDRNCAPCGWRKLGVCKEALERLRASAGSAVSSALPMALAVATLAMLALQAPLARAQNGATAPAVPDSPPLTTSSTPPMPLPTPAPQPSVLSAPGYLTADQVEQQLVLDRKKRIPALYKVQTALAAKDWHRAGEAAKALDKRADFADYQHYLLGQAEMGRMKKFVQSHAAATALLAAEQARYHFNQVLAADPYTTLWKRADMFLGQTELAMAEIELKAKHRTNAQSHYEAGFQRLSQVSLLALVPKANIVSYALLCEKKRSDLCTSWVLRLIPFVSRSDDARVLDRIAAFKHPAIERAPSQPYRVDLDLQAFQNGFESYRHERYEEAYSIWRDLLQAYPRTTIKLRTKFWMGRAAQKSQHLVQAETLFREIIKELPFSYYALLASWFGEIDLSRMMDAELPVATPNTTMLTPADLTHVRRAEILIASAVPELAQFELQDVRANTNMPNEFLVYLTLLNHLAGNHQVSFSILSELSSRNFAGLFSSYGQKLYFPTVRMPLIREAAREWRVDPLLVLSIVKQESAFNEEAVSPAAAYGLMQLIAPTARELERTVEISDLFIPHVNLRLGARYMRQMLTRYKGNVILALAAYNSGPGNADHWSREGGALPPEELIETIAFRETREYVENILRNYYWYSRRIKGETSPNLMALTQTISPWKAPPHGMQSAPASLHVRR